MRWSWSATGRVLGEALVRRVDAADTLEVGCAFARPVQRQGLGTGVVSGLLAAVWTHLPARTILAHVVPANVPSRRLLAKLGFRGTGPGTAALGAGLLRLELPGPPPT